MSRHRWSWALPLAGAIPYQTTGTQAAILSGHIEEVGSLTFSSDGTSLVSGGYDTTIKLWDMQTGGVVKSFYGHTDLVFSVSISSDSTTIVSGSHDKTIRLWDIQTEGCHHIMEQLASVTYVIFSPANPQTLLSVSGEEIQWWDTNGHKINCSYDGSYAAFSSDGSQLVLCQGADIVIQDSDSGIIKTRFHLSRSTAGGCCFSPDSSLVAIAADDSAVYI